MKILLSNFSVSNTEGCTAVSKEYIASTVELIQGAFQMARGDRSQLLNSLQAKGDRIHYSLPEIVPFSTKDLFIFSHPDDITTIWDGNSSLLDKKGPLYEMIRRHTGDGLFTMPGDDKWKSHQRLIGPCMAHLAGNDLKESVSSSISMGLDHPTLGISSSGELENPHRFFKAVSMYLNATSFLGVEIEFDDASKLADAFTTIHDFTDINVRNFGLPELLDKVTPIFQSRTHHAEDFVNKAAKELQQQKSQPGTLLSALKQQTPEGNFLTEEEITDEVITILAAGHGTISTAVTFALHELSLEENRDYQTLIHKNLGEQLSDSLLTASFQESMRLYPPVYITIREAGDAISTSNERGEINIAKGSLTALSPYLTHRHPDFWKDAETFIPERFMNGTKFPKNAYIPFGSGKRKCIGEHLAMRLGPGLMSEMMQRFKSETQTPIKPQFAATIRPTKDFRLKLTSL